jgi:hypothetical protein
VTAFEAHRVGDTCVDPAELGMIAVDGLWATAQGHIDSTTRAARMRARNADRARARG